MFQVLGLLEDYEYIYVIGIENARNEHLAKLREQWNHSRFVFGKNRLIAHALVLASEQMDKPKLKDLAQVIIWTSLALISYSFSAAQVVSYSPTRVSMKLKSMLSFFF